MPERSSTSKGRFRVAFAGASVVSLLMGISGGGCASGSARSDSGQPDAKAPAPSGTRIAGPGAGGSASSPESLSPAPDVWAIDRYGGIRFEAAMAALDTGFDAAVLAAYDAAMEVGLPPRRPRSGSRGRLLTSIVGNSLGGYRAGVDLPFDFDAPLPPEDDPARLPLTSLLGGAGAGIDEIAPVRRTAPVTPRDAEEAARLVASGETARRDQRLLKAAGDLRRAVELDPSSVAGWRALARTYDAVGNRRLAMQAWGEVAARRPLDLEAAGVLADDALARGQSLVALSLLRPWLIDGGPVPAESGGTRRLAPIDGLRAVRATHALDRPRATLDVADRVYGLSAPAGGDGGTADASAIEAAVARVVRSDPGPAHAEIALAAGDAANRLGAPDRAAAWYAAAATQTGATGSRRLEAAIRFAQTGRDGPRERDVFFALAAPDSGVPILVAFDAVAPRHGARASRGGAIVASEFAATLAEFAYADPSFAERLEPVRRRVAMRSAARQVALRPALSAAAERLSLGPATSLGYEADRGTVASIPWVHPLPGVTEQVSAVLGARPRVITRDDLDALGAPSSSDRTRTLRIGPDEAVILSALVEACGHAGRAHAIAGQAAEAWPGWPRPHVAAIRLAGRMRDRAALRVAIARAHEAGWCGPDVEAIAIAAGSEGAPRVMPPPGSPLSLDVAARWRRVTSIAIVNALALSDQLDEAVRLAEAAARLPIEQPMVDVSGVGIMLTLGAARLEHAVTGGDVARGDLTAAASGVSAVVTADAARTVGWDLIEAMLGSGSPVADATLLARQRARRQAERPDDPALLARQRRVASLPMAERLEASRARLRVAPDDRRAADDLVSALVALGRAADAEAWLEARLDRAPADPLAATLLVRLDASVPDARGVPGDARDRLDARLARHDGDLMALRLSETAAALATDRMMRLILAEERLLERPESPARGLEIARLARDAGLGRDAIDAIGVFESAAADVIPRDLFAAVELLRQVGGPDASEALVAIVETAAAADGPIPEELVADALVPIAEAAAAATTVDAATSAVARFESLVGHAMDGTASAAGPSGVLTAWRELGQSLVDAGHPAAAAAALEMRVASERDETPVVAQLASMIVAAEASAAVRDDHWPPRPAAAAEPAAPLASNPSARGIRTRRVIEVLADRGALGRFGLGSPGPDGAGDGGAHAARAAALQRASGIHRLVGSEATADALLAEALVLVPNDPGTLNDLGYTRLIERGSRDAEAASMVERAAEITAAAGAERPAILDSLGWLRYLEGRHAGDEGSVRILERAIELDDRERPSAEIRLHLGDARWRSGDAGGARQAWEQGLGILEVDRHRLKTEQEYRSVQLAGWGLLVREPADMYNAQFGSTADALRSRLDAVRRGIEPPVTPIWDESAPDAP